MTPTVMTSPSVTSARVVNTQKKSLFLNGDRKSRSCRPRVPSAAPLSMVAGRTDSKTSDTAELLHNAEEAGRLSAPLARDNVRDHPRVGPFGNVVAGLHQQEGDEEESRCPGYRQQPETDDVDRGAS